MTANAVSSNNRAGSSDRNRPGNRVARTIGSKRNKMEAEKLRKNLSDAGCSGAAAGAIIDMYEAGHEEDALRLIRKARCRALDEMHKSGRKVDCLDYLIRSMRAEMK